MIEPDDEACGSAPWVALKAGVLKGLLSAERQLIPFHPGWN
jgi:hypothetical protein